MESRSDPLRRPDQQSRDPGSAAPPDWWPGLWTAALPTEVEPRAPRSWAGPAQVLRVVRIITMALTPVCLVGALVAATMGVTWAVLGLVLGWMAVAAGVGSLHRHVTLLAARQPVPSHRHPDGQRRLRRLGR